MLKDLLKKSRYLLKSYRVDKSGIITPIIVLFQCHPLQDLLKPSFMENDSFHITFIRLSEDLMLRGKVLCMLLIQWEVMKDYNVVLVVLPQLSLCLF